ncbi:MAG: hypothetical protein IJD04_07925 [Desulfovibrionaceae bacterium]|nr:hypothetical protein [Desulfovibrionaceae bacterium]
MKILKKIHWPSALLSVFLALTVCFALSGRERVETWIDVRLEIKDMPEGYVLLNSNGLPSTVEVRLSGPSGLIRNLDGQNLPMMLSLSDIKQGYNLLSLNEDDIPLSGAFDIMEIRPNSVEVNADKIVEKEVKLTARSTQPLPEGITKIELILPQNTIMLKGPRTLLEEVSKVDAVVSLPASILKRELTLPSNLSLPQGIKAHPAHVNVLLRAEGKPKAIILQRPVKLAHKNPDSPGLQISPEAVTITLQVPFDWNEKNQALAQLYAEVSLPDDGIIDKPLTREVKIISPEETRVLSVKPEKVSITPN